MHLNFIYFLTFLLFPVEEVLMLASGPPESPCRQEDVGGLWMGLHFLLLINQEARYVVELPCFLAELSLCDRYPCVTGIPRLLECYRAKLFPAEIKHTAHKYG